MEHLAGGIRPFLPGNRPDDGLHVDQAFDAFRVSFGPVEAQGRAPIVHHQRDTASQIHGVEPSVQNGAVVGETVGAVGRTPRFAHAHQVRCQAPANRTQMGNDVAPKIGRRGIPVEEYDGIPIADIHVRNLSPTGGYSPVRMGVLG